MMTDNTKLMEYRLDAAAAVRAEYTEAEEFRIQRRAIAAIAAKLSGDKDLQESLAEFSEYNVRVQQILEELQTAPKSEPQTAHGEGYTLKELRMDIRTDIRTEEL